MRPAYVVFSPSLSFSHLCAQVETYAALVVALGTHWNKKILLPILSPPSTPSMPALQRLSLEEPCVSAAPAPQESKGDAGVPSPSLPENPLGKRKTPAEVQLPAQLQEGVLQLQEIFLRTETAAYESRKQRIEEDAATRKKELEETLTKEYHARLERAKRNILLELNEAYKPKYIALEEERRSRVTELKSSHEERMRALEETIAESKRKEEESVRKALLVQEEYRRACEMAAKPLDTVLSEAGIPPYLQKKYKLTETPK